MVVLGADTSPRGGAPSGVDRSAWFGARWRAFELLGSRFEMGPALRIGLPMQSTGPAPRIEPAFAAGGANGDLRWLVNLGARVRLGGAAEDRTSVPAGQVSLIAGSIGLLFGLIVAALLALPLSLLPEPYNFIAPATMAV